jgi:two-component system sensor histidine kinase/response regulator
MRAFNMQDNPIRILIIEDDEDDYILISALFSEIREKQYKVEWAANYDEGLNQIKQKSHDVYLVDYRLGKETGLDLLQAAIKNDCRAPIILLTGQGDHKLDLEAMKSGAADYLVKGQFNAPVLERSVRYAIERKRVLEELKIAKETAEAASRARADFLSNISHEIRTPLNGIIGMTELTLDTNLTNEQKDYLISVKHSSESLLEIINEILDLSKIEAGKLNIENIEFSIRDCIDDIIRSLVIRAYQKNLEVIYNVDDDIPDRLIGDPGRLRQILLNLIGNAIKFTNKGQVVIQIKTQGKRKNDVLLHFSVTDTGIGIPLDKQNIIFDPFAQVDSSTTRKHGGTGLGLTICKQLVELMVGKIWFESPFRIEDYDQEDAGSCFHFTISYRIQHKPNLIKTPADDKYLKGLKILVVDDNHTNLRFMKDFLTNHGMIPVLVENGNDALKELKKAKKENSSFKLVLLDNHMPEMDGFLLAERIKANRQLSKNTLIMLTSGGKRGDAELCRRIGIVAYLMKPVRQSELLNTISHIVNKIPSGRKKSELITRHTIRESRYRLNVLLAEDNQINQKVAKRMLEKMGYMVTVVNNGIEAIQRFHKYNYDIILMDVQMPEMDGFEATRIIRREEKYTGNHVPIIALTAHAMKGDRDRCIHEGMDGYASKPIKFTELLDIIETHVSSIKEKQKNRMYQKATQI